MKEKESANTKSVFTPMRGGAAFGGSNAFANCAVAAKKRKSDEKE